MNFLDEFMKDFQLKCRSNRSNLCVIRLFNDASIHIRSHLTRGQISNHIWCWFSQFQCINVIYVQGVCILRDACISSLANAAASGSIEWKWKNNERTLVTTSGLIPQPGYQILRETWESFCVPWAVWTRTGHDQVNAPLYCIYPFISCFSLHEPFRSTPG